MNQVDARCLISRVGLVLIHRLHVANDRAGPIGVLLFGYVSIGVICVAGRGHRLGIGVLQRHRLGGCERRSGTGDGVRRVGKVAADERAGGPHIRLQLNALLRVVGC